MLKRTITYTDYNGVERTEDFLFNLTKAEIMEMEVGTTGGFTDMLKRIVKSKDAPLIMKVFRDIVLKAYGEKSEDGRRLMKSKEISEAFAQTEAYSILIMELYTEPEKAAAFVNGIVPAEVAEKAKDRNNAMLEAYKNTGKLDLEVLDGNE